MAYVEDYALLSDQTVFAQISVALLIAARNVITGDTASTPSGYERKVWAKNIIAGDNSTINKVLRILVTEANHTTIIASDTALQTYINNLVTFLATN